MKHAIIIAALSSLWFAAPATADVKAGAYFGDNGTHAVITYVGHHKPYVGTVKRLRCKPVTKVRVVRYRAGVWPHNRVKRVKTRTVVGTRCTPHRHIVKRPVIVIPVPALP